MILEFLGGAAFRVIAGQIISVWTKYQDHKHEKELLLLQAQLDDKAAERQMQQQRLAAELQVRTVEIQRDADVQREEAIAFRSAMSEAFKPTGIKWVDAWNGTIRPAFATTVLFLWYKALYAQSFVPSEWDKDMMGMVAGFFFADRQMKKSGK
jgi:hypothetical protein